MELELRKWLAHTNDIVAFGTPSTCRRLTDLPEIFWNKMMGNMDTVRKVLKKRKVVCGPDSGPVSIMWSLYCLMLSSTYLDYDRVYN